MSHLGHYLPALRSKLQAIFSAGEEEDVVCWRIDERGRARVALIIASDGRQLEMDGYALTWQWPPKRLRLHVDPPPSPRPA